MYSYKNIMMLQFIERKRGRKLFNIRKFHTKDSCKDVKFKLRIKKKNAILKLAIKTRDFNLKKKYLNKI